MLIQVECTRLIDEMIHCWRAQLGCAFKRNSSPKIDVHVYTTGLLDVQKSSEPQALQTVDKMEGKSTNFTEYSIYLYAVW